MAITIVATPSLFSPALNDAIWQIATDRTDILYFQVVVYAADGVTVISKLKAQPTPALRQGAYVNLTQVLKNIVNTTISKNDVIIEEYDDVVSYKLSFTEYIYNVTSNTVSIGASATTSFVNTWNGQIPKIAMGDYDYTTLTATATSTPKFLTNKPTSVSKYWLSEYLYYLNNGRVTAALFTLNYSTGTVTKSFNIPLGKKSGRVNISPRSLVVADISLSNLISFNVCLMAGAVVASQTVTRYYNNVLADCHDKPVSIIWANDLGGTDSYLFKNPQEKVTVTSTTINTNSYAVNSAGFYAASNANIYQSSEIIIASDSTSEYTVVSDWLNNDEEAWLKASILGSKAVFVELTNGKLLPVKVTLTTVSIIGEYATVPNSLTLTYSTETGLNQTVKQAIANNQIVGQIGTSNPDIVLQTTDYEVVVGLNGQALI
ncbi:hypothetical protein [Pedobacter sp. L105]|uniref:hypothetical protein n=1 Tax=Pedobacter sp. L105 TaxID=1641871 RepID=UPI00131BDB0F|nr:hypothetical protein [Pedobacter sp. L105]